MSFADIFKELERIDEIRSSRWSMLEMKKFLAGALCTVCGEQLGDEIIIQNDEGNTMHERCEEIEKDFK